jgi:hypothetical protein
MNDSRDVPFRRLLVTWRLSRSRLPDWTTPSPLGWIAWYSVSRALELYVLADFWRLACYFQALLTAVLIFPQSVRDLKRHVIGERIPWEYRFWNALASRLPVFLGTRAAVPALTVVVLLTLSPVLSFVPAVLALVRDPLLLLACGVWLWVFSPER